MGFDGTWKVNAQTPMGPQESILQFAEDGSTLTGTVSTNGETVDIYDGAVDGDSATWKADVTAPMQLTIVFTGELDGDEITATQRLDRFPPARTRGVAIPDHRLRPRA